MCILILSFLRFIYFIYTIINICHHRRKIPIILSGRGKEGITGEVTPEVDLERWVEFLKEGVLGSGGSWAQTSQQAGHRSSVAVVWWGQCEQALGFFVSHICPFYAPAKPRCLQETFLNNLSYTHHILQGHTQRLSNLLKPTSPARPLPHRRAFICQGQWSLTLAPFMQCKHHWCLFVKQLEI